MNKRCAVAARGLLIGICLNTCFLSAASAEKLIFAKELDTDERRCLGELIHASDWWKYTPQFTGEMMRIAQVARLELNGKRHMAYLYLFEDVGWCGTAGCPMLIGELRSDGVCHLLYDGNGIDKIIVLQVRDHGYRRLYTPCEVRFDGREYRQVHEQCPTLDVQR